MPMPTVNRMVHYISHGTPLRPDGSQAYTSRCRAAIITEVGPETDEVLGQAYLEGWDKPEYLHIVGLVAINPTGFFFHSLTDGGCRYDTNRSAGTWHWPEHEHRSDEEIVREILFNKDNWPKPKGDVYAQPPASLKCEQCDRAVTLVKGKPQHVDRALEMDHRPVF